MTATETPAVDAWQHLADLYERFGRTWKVRTDIRVTANGPDRHIVLDIDGRYRRGNVGTMRELAQVLHAAADFVEAANPEWATHLARVQTPAEFEEESDG